MRRGPTLDSDRELCTAILPSVSRTFALSIAALPEALRETVGVAYLLCRIADTIEDEKRLEPATRERLFDCFEALVREDRGDAVELERANLGELCARAGSVFAVFRSLPATPREVCRPNILEMAHGMREYRRRAEDLRFRDLADLERYCYFVAGTVGKMLTGLFELIVPSLPPDAREAVRARAVSFGLGLQLVNIVKDVHEDLERGDCFVPLEVLADHGIDLADLRGRSDAGLAAVRTVCARARDHLRRAREYTLAWPDTDVRFFCAVPLALALATLREVEAGNATKVTRDVVAEILSDAQRAVAGDASLAAFLERHQT